MNAAALLAFCAHLLWLLPLSFRQRYGDQWRLTARDLLRDTPPAHRPRLLLFLLFDLVSTAAREHVRNLRRNPMNRSIVWSCALLLVVLGAFSALSAVFSHTALRSSANQPQQQMAERYAARLAAGADPAQVLPASPVNFAADLDPFALLIDRSGRLIAGNGSMGDSHPLPPAGLLARAQEQGSATVTWQPARGVRVAAVVVRVTGPHPGTLVVGRSLAVTEQYESSVYRLALWGHILLLLAVFGAALLIARGTRSVHPAPAA